MGVDESAITVNIGALLPRASITRELPIDFDLDLGPLLGVESDSAIRLSASAGFDPDFLIGVYLGSTVPGASSNLTAGTLLDTLNEGAGVDIKTAAAVTAADSVNKIFGRLQSDATFTLQVTTASGTTTSSYTVKASDTSTNTTTAHLVQDINSALAVASVRTGAIDTFALAGDAAFGVAIGGVTYTVTVTAASTATNATLADLAADIVTALQNAKDPALATVDLTGGTRQLTAVQDGQVIVLKTAPGGAAQFDVTVVAGNPAETALKLPAGTTTGKRLNSLVLALADENRLALVAHPTVTDLKLTASQNDAAVRELGFQKEQVARGPLVGSNLDDFVLNSGSALFKLTIGSTTYDVTVPAASTALNSTIGDLVADVNDALANAKITGTTTTVDLTPKIMAERSEEHTSDLQARGHLV